MLKYLSIAFVLIGAFFMILGLMHAKRMLTLKSAFTQSWKLLFGFIIFFILSYFTFSFLVYKTYHSNLLFVVSLVFLIAGFFVYLVAELSVRTIEQIKKVVKFKLLAQHDGLTGIYNQRYFKKALRERLAQIKRGGHNCVLMFLDLDDFKSINDLYGHLSGDKMLIKTAKILFENIRKTDLVARIGGDEFCVFLYNTEVENAREIARKMCQQINKYAADNFEKCKNFGCSIGAIVMDSSFRDVSRLIEQADRACYEVKKQHKKQKRNEK